MKTTTATIWAIEWVVEENNDIRTSRSWSNIFTDKESAIAIASSTIKNDDTQNHYFSIGRVKEITAGPFGSIEKVIAEFNNFQYLQL